MWTNRNRRSSTRRRCRPGRCPRSNVDVDVEAARQVAHDVGARCRRARRPGTTGPRRRPWRRPANVSARKTVGIHRQAASRVRASRMPVPPRQTPTSRMSPSTCRAGRAAPTARSTCTGRRTCGRAMASYTHRNSASSYHGEYVEFIGTISSWEYRVASDSSFVTRCRRRSRRRSSRSQPCARFPLRRTTSRGVHRAHRDLAAAGDRVEPALVPRDLDVARAEPGPDEHRPQVAGVVVRLVVVHLLLRRDAEPERGELEEPLATPRRHVDDAHAAGRRCGAAAPAVASGSSRCSSTLLQMMRVDAVVGDVAEHIREAAAQQRAGRRLERRVDGDVDEQDGGRLVEQLRRRARRRGRNRCRLPGGPSRRRGSAASAPSTASARGGRRARVGASWANDVRALASRRTRPRPVAIVAAWISSVNTKIEKPATIRNSPVTARWLVTDSSGRVMSFWK